MNTETAGQYASRCIRELGLQANDTERAVIWCFDHPPKRELPKSIGARERNLFISRKVFQCLVVAAGEHDAGNGDTSVGKLSESILLLWIKDNIPEIWAMYERHEQEVDMRLAELRRNEPELQKEEA